MLSVHDAVFGSADLSLHILPPGGGGYRWMETIAIITPPLPSSIEGIGVRKSPATGFPLPPGEGE
jgi:hypothetical protein